MDSGNTCDTGAGEVVTINIRGDTKIGIMVDPDKDGSAAVVRGWDRLANGKFGVVQKVSKLNLINYGDNIYYIYICMYYC
jgi:hypothetical protein